MKSYRGLGERQVSYSTNEGSLKLPPSALRPGIYEKPWDGYGSNPAARKKKGHRATSARGGDSEGRQSQSAKLLELSLFFLIYPPYSASIFFCCESIYFSRGYLILTFVAAAQLTVTIFGYSSSDTHKMAAFPPPPVNTIDWSNVGFKVREGTTLDLFDRRVFCD